MTNYIIERSTHVTYQSFEFKDGQQQIVFLLNFIKKFRDQIGRSIPNFKTEHIKKFSASRCIGEIQKSPDDEPRKCWSQLSSPTNKSSPEYVRKIH